MAKYKTLDKKMEAAESSQDVIFTEIGEIGDNKLRIIIRSNAYVQNSSATISRFDGTKWQQVARILPDSMQVKNGLIYQVKRPMKDPRKPEGVTEYAFNEDRFELIRQAELVLT